MGFITPSVPFVERRIIVMLRYIRKFKLLFVGAMLLMVLTNGLLVGSSVVCQKHIDYVAVLDRELVTLYVPLCIA